MSKASEELKLLFLDQQDWEIVKRSNFEVLTESTELLEGRDFQGAISFIFEYIQEEKILDIQLICLYLQAHFNLNHSADDFVSSIDILGEVLAKYELISPLNKKDLVVMRSVLALLNEANDAINYYYPDFLDSQQEQVADRLSNIQDSLSENIEGVDLVEFNKSKNQTILTIAKYLIKEEKETEVVEDVLEKELTVLNTSKEERYSFAWANLLLKISRFSSLANTAVESPEKFELALLFDSIQSEIDNFNPIKYFPKEFETFLNSVTPEGYTEIQQIVENSKGSPLWDFMLHKTEANIQIDPNNKFSEIGDFNVDEVLKKSAYTQLADSSNQNSYSNYEAEQKHQEDDFDSAFDALDL